MREEKQKTWFTNDKVTSTRIIYTASDFARNTLAYLQETGTLTARTSHLSSRSDLNSYLFFLVRSGEGTLTYRGQEYHLVPGDCVFIDCRNGYSKCSSSKLWTLSWVHFYGSNLRSIYGKYCQRGGKPVFHQGDEEVYQGLLSEIYRMAGSDSYIRDMELDDLLRRLLLQIMRETVRSGLRQDEGKRSRASRMDLSAVKEYIDAHYTEKMKLDDLAARFYLSKQYLMGSFKEQYGTTIVACINQMRITKAKELLRFTDLTVEAIAVDCGFEPNYFARVFRKLEGMPPSEYREKWWGRRLHKKTD